MVSYGQGLSALSGVSRCFFQGTFRGANDTPAQRILLIGGTQRTRDAADCRYREHTDETSIVWYVCIIVTYSPFGDNKELCREDSMVGIIQSGG